MPGTRITDAELKEMFDNLPDIARRTGVMESLALGSFIVRKFLSNEWANKHIVPGGGRTGFLTIDESTPERREVTFYRVIVGQEFPRNSPKLRTKGWVRHPLLRNLDEGNSRTVGGQLAASTVQRIAHRIRAKLGSLDLTFGLCTRDKPIRIGYLLS